MKEVEDSRDSMLMVSMEKDGIWYQLRFDCFAGLDILEKEKALEVFEEMTLNIRTRIHKTYTAKNQIT